MPLPPPQQCCGSGAYCHAMLAYFHRGVGFSCLHSKHFYPLSHLPSPTFSHYVTSLASNLQPSCFSLKCWDYRYVLPYLRFKTLDSKNKMHCFMRSMKMISSPVGIGPMSWPSEKESIDSRGNTENNWGTVVFLSQRWLYCGLQVIWIWCCWSKSPVLIQEANSRDYYRLFTKSNHWICSRRMGRNKSSVPMTRFTKSYQPPRQAHEAD